MKIFSLFTRALSGPKTEKFVAGRVGPGPTRSPSRPKIVTKSLISNFVF